MASSISARDGRVISLTIRGFGPFVPELVRRREDPSVAVHYYTARDGCKLDDQQGWADANPGLGSIKALGYMEDMARKAVLIPADETNFRQFDLNQEVDPRQTKIVSKSHWERCEVEDADALPLREGEMFTSA